MIFRKNTHQWNSNGYWNFLAILLLLFFSDPINSFAQSRVELERQRAELIREIEKTTTKLNQTQKNKKNTFNAFSSLRNQVENRQTLIATITQQVELSDQRINQINLRLDTIEINLTELETEYGQLLKNAYRLKVNKNWFLFLLSAKSINDSFKRWRYIKQMESYRKRHMRLLLETSSELEIRKQELEREKTEKIYLLETVEEQNRLLYSELNRKSSLLNSLSVSEKKLIQALNRQKADEEKLSIAIRSIIERAIAAAGTPDVKRTVPALGNTALDSESRRFFANRGQLPWPLEKAVITKQFGKQVHASVKTIQVTNNGIDLRGNSSSTEVSAVFNGTVVGIQFIPGFKNTVIVKHGIFYTVYSNLEEVFIERGDNVGNQQIIGRLNKKKPELHFEVWQEKKRLNPISWLVRKS